MENNKTISGTIRITSKPMGFVEVEGYDDDIVIFEEGLNCALNKDVVEIALLGKERSYNGKPARFKGAVVKIIERHKTQFVGVFEKSPFGLVFRPDDWKFYRYIEVDELKDAEGKEVKEGVKALVDMLEWTNPSLNPKGKLVSIIGEKGVHETEMQSILLDRGIVYDFPSYVEENAKEVADEAREILKKARTDFSIVGDRRDFRNITTFTIDPVTAKDFDDALSFEILDDKTYRIGVHIADVSHFVVPGTPLDKEALNRLFSTYLVDRTVPMLPEDLSNDMCSLNPNEDRFSFSSVFDIDKNTGEVKERWFGKTVIRSDKRFSYEEAQEVLNKMAGEFLNELSELTRLARVYRAENKKNGAIEFETDEVKFDLDSIGKPIRIYKKARVETMKMIEEWMLLANKEVAKFISENIEKRGGAGLYRVHDMPNIEKLEELQIFVRALGYELPIKDGVIKAKDINNLLFSLEGNAAESLVKTAAVRSMAKAIYSTKNIGHFGLAFEYYTHFTSPIRRYPDLMVHRILQNILTKGQVDKNEIATFQKIADKASEKEVAVAEAERESIKYKQVEYMQEKVGEVFDGIISGVTEYGMYVEEVNTRSDGMVRIKDMFGDQYELDPKNYCLVGRNTKNKFSLGDKVKVKLVSANIDRKTLDFQLV